MLAQLAQFSNSVGGHDFLWFSVFWLLTTIFWLWMLVDCLTSKKLPHQQKLIWVLVLLLTHILGAILYFALGRRGQAGGNLPPDGP